MHFDKNGNAYAACDKCGTLTALSGLQLTKVPAGSIPVSRDLRPVTQPADV